MGMERKRERKAERGNHRERECRRKKEREKEGKNIISKNRLCQASQIASALAMPSLLRQAI